MAEIHTACLQAPLPHRKPAGQQISYRGSSWPTEAGAELTSFRTTSVLVLGATVLAALAVRFWPARHEERPPAVPSLAVALAPRGAGGDPEFSPPISDQGVQRGIVEAEAIEAGVEPMSTSPDPASAESWSAAVKWLSLYELHALDRADRTPRPYVPGCVTLPPTAFVCPGNWALLTEEVDPEWSHATEERLRAIWNENVTGVPSDFLFVMCKTTLCQINYRFPPGSDGAAINKPLGLFNLGFRASELVSELRRTCAYYAGTTVALEYERKFSQTGRQSLQRDRMLCERPGLKQQGP
jgi:hypothetical protein